jgi:phenylpropionate dioxygenase-like ring-hydroxylating dioxygenase large terminal subunit
VIPNQWYPIVQSSQLEDRPVGVERLGRQLVVWRNADGKPACAIDRCVHKGAKLSLGKVADGCVECPYHGLRFDDGGRCVLVPYMGKKWDVPPNWRVDAFTVREECGLVWLWYGDDEPTVEVPWFDEVPRDTARTWESSDIWPYHYTRLMDSNFDVYHFPFVHSSLNPGLGPVVTDYHAEIDGDLIRTRTTLDKYEDEREPGSTGKTFLLDVRMPTLMHIQFTEKLWLLAVVTPIDEQRSWVFGRYYANYPLGGAIASLAGRFEFGTVQDQDKRILDTLRKGPVGQHEYVMGGPDKGSLLWAKRRRQLIAEAEKKRAEREGVKS